MPGPAIEVHDLVVRYGTTVAVDRISFEAQAAQVVALLGPNGAGKTSTIETLEGYRRPTLGRVRVLGLDPQRDHKALTRRIGVMLQRGGVYPTMTPHEAVALFAQYYEQSDEPDGLLFRVGLADVLKTPWRRLSGGEQQRLSLALALVGRPWVAFLDEPTAGVDPQGRLTIRQVISDLRASGTCVLLTTHELEEAERLADRILIIDHGRIVADGTPSELTTRAGGGEIHFGGPAGLDVVGLGGALSAVVTEERPGEYLVRAEPRPATIAALTAWLAERDLPLSDLRAGRQRLEDVFLRLTSGGGAGDGDTATLPEGGCASGATSPGSSSAGGSTSRGFSTAGESTPGGGATDGATSAGDSSGAAGGGEGTAPAVGSPQGADYIPRHLGDRQAGGDIVDDPPTLELRLPAGAAGGGTPEDLRGGPRRRRQVPSSGRGPGVTEVPGGSASSGVSEISAAEEFTEAFEERATSEAAGTSEVPAASDKERAE